MSCLSSATKIARINVVIDEAFQAWPPVMASDELDSLASSGMPAGECIMAFFHDKGA